MCVALRAHGNTQLNKMLKSVRSLTLKEFCETYKGDTQYYLEQTRKRLATKLSNEIKKRPKLIENEKVYTHTIQKKKKKKFGNLFNIARYKNQYTSMLKKKTIPILVYD